VRIELPKIDGVVRLPLAALRQDQGATAVWLVDPDTMTVRTQRVQVAGADGNLAVIAGGLAEGQRVVTAGVHVLTPGQKVTLYAEPRATGAAPASPAAASAPRS
jgi:membrane fusion protein, multidrug efflux system